MIGHMEEVWNLVKVIKLSSNASFFKFFYYFYRQEEKKQCPPQRFWISIMYIFKKNLKTSFFFRNTLKLLNLRFHQTPETSFSQFILAWAISHICLYLIFEEPLTFSFQNPISLKELLEIYETKLVATYEKSLGQSLLANEISSLAYWNFADKNRDGFMTLKQFVDFLRVCLFFYLKKKNNFAFKMFRLSVSSEKLAFMREFKFGLQFHQSFLILKGFCLDFYFKIDEYSKDVGEKDEITRFDFFRYIFLERNL